MKDTKIIQMNDQFDQTEEAYYIKSYLFIRGFAVGKNLKQTMMALSLARQLHDGQYRKYIRETSMFLIPMASYCKKYYPEYTNTFSILKNNIDSMNRSMDVMLCKIEALEDGVQKEQAAGK